MTAPVALSLERPGTVIAYRRTGTGPPLLLLHATLSTSSDLRVLASRLSGSFTVFSVDRRGSGDSQPPPTEPPVAIDVATHVADLEAVIASEGLAPAVVVGHSYGGCLALELAARRPALVSRVWAYEPPYAPAGPEAARRVLVDVGRRTSQASKQGGPPAAAEAFLSTVAGADVVEALSPTARERVRSQGRGAIADATLLGLDPDGLHRIVCPVVIATGSKSQAMYADVAAGLVARIGQAQRVTLDDADHLAPLTRPASVVAAIEAFAAA